MNLYLIGYRGSGKTTLGRRLAEETRYRFTDTDELIVQKTGKPIPRIFSEDGELYFRDQETQVLREISREKGLIVSTGGGIVMKPENREILKKTGWCVYLATSAEEAYRRIGGDPNRPALTSLPAFEEIQKMLELRGPLYRECAGFTIDTGLYDIRDCVNAVISWWNAQKGIVC